MTALTFTYSSDAAAQNSKLVVRIAQLDIDPAQLENYKSMLKEGIEAAVREEPGVLSLYAVGEKENPAHITVFEIYADSTAYQSHLKTVHFQKYKTGTSNMVKSLRLVETVPIGLEVKPDVKTKLKR
jgi:quinol monooxygenase YgiN